MKAKNDFKKGMKTLDYVKNKSYPELKKIPLEQVKLDRNSLNEHESFLRGNVYPAYYSGKKRFLTRPIEILFNLLGKKLPMQKRYSERQKQVMRDEFSDTIIPQLKTTEEKIEYTKKFEKYLKKL